MIECPPERVWQYFSDVSNVRKWDPELIEVKQTSDGSFGLNAMLQMVMKVAGRRQVFDTVITEFEPNERIAYRGAASLGAVLVRYTLQPVVGGTRLSRSFELEPSAAYKLLEPVFRVLVHRRMVKRPAHQLTNIKRLAEARQ